MSIIFKKQTNKKVLRKKNPFSFFKKNKSTTIKENSRVKSHRRSKALKIVALALFVVVLLGGFFLVVSKAISYISYLKSDKAVSANSGNVIGFEDIPAYPDSEFVFKDNTKDEYVRKFLSQGRSIYRLKPKTSITSVYEYYNAKLGESGWEHVLSVPLEAEDKSYGEYWIKDGKGLHVYGKYNDVWYERITVTEAKTGMQDEVKKTAELKLLLTSKEFEDLRPDYPWKLQVPSEYLITYLPTDMGELLAVEFKKMSGNDRLVIYPIGYTGALPMDTQLDKYLVKKNKDDKANWKVISSIVTTVNSLDAIKASIVNGDTGGEAYVVNNTRNNVNYVFMANTTTNPLMKYITEKIAAVRKSYNEPL